MLVVSGGKNDGGNMKIFYPLPEIRPNWLRKFICILYFPIIVPVIILWALIISLFSAVINLVISLINDITISVYVIWRKFIVACWKGE